MWKTMASVDLCWGLKAPSMTSWTKSNISTMTREWRKWQEDYHCMKEIIYCIYTYIHDTCVCSIWKLTFWLFWCSAIYLHTKTRSICAPWLRCQKLELKTTNLFFFYFSQRAPLTLSLTKHYISLTKLMGGICGKPGEHCVTSRVQG